MRIVLAVFLFIFATLCLGYCALFSYAMSQYFREYGFNGWQYEIVRAFIIMGVSFLIGIGFVVAGLLVLSSKSRRNR